MDFGRQSCDDQKALVANLAAIKKFWSLLYVVNENFQSLLSVTSFFRYGN
jgi:hypothetical protein